MPQLKAAKKDIRKNQRRRVKNDRWRVAMREATHAVRDAIKAHDKTLAQKAYQAAQKAIDRAVRRHVLHANKAARKKSRLLKSIANIAAK